MARPKRLSIGGNEQKAKRGVSQHQTQKLYIVDFSKQFEIWRAFKRRFRTAWNAGTEDMEGGDLMIMIILIVYPW